ncbi:MAG: glycosyltransferase [Firmicutes bacterium]|nr:glycosyltransferase [Bacillota bacterium]
MKRASIIIPTKDKLSRLRLVLKALEPQVNDSIEVIIIFDGCNQKTLEGFKEIQLTYELIKIVYPQNVGRAKARNLGIRQAKGDIIIFVDDDRIPCPGFIEMHIRRHQHKRYAVMGERLDICFFEEELDRFYWSETKILDMVRDKKGIANEKYDILRRLTRPLFGNLLACVAFCTGNLSVRREDLLKVGMFDEKIIGWGIEDVDLGYRLIKDGIKLVRDYSLRNYHLVHPVDNKQQKVEYWRNFDYFLNKIKGDRVAILMAKLTTLVLYGRRPRTF